MDLTEAQYRRIAHLLPVQRANVRTSIIQMLNAILYGAEQGCKRWIEVERLIRRLNG